MAGRVGFDGGQHQLPLLAQAGGHLRQVDPIGELAAIDVEEAKAAVIGPRGADEALAGQRAGGQRGRGGPAGVEALVPGAVLEELHRARGHRDREALRVRQLLGRKAHEPAGGERAAEDADHAGGVEADLVEGTARASADARRRFHADEVGRDHLAARGARHGGGREGGGQDAGGGVDDAGDMRVVIVEAVAEIAVHGRGVAGAEAVGIAEDRHVTGAAERSEAAQHGLGEGIARRGERDAGGVEHVVDRPGAHLGGNVGVPQAKREGGELLGQRQANVGLDVHGVSSCERAGTRLLRLKLRTMVPSCL